MKNITILSLIKMTLFSIFGDSKNIKLVRTVEDIKRETGFTFKNIVISDDFVLNAFSNKPTTYNYNNFDECIIIMYSYIKSKQYDAFIELSKHVHDLVFNIANPDRFYEIYFKCRYHYNKSINENENAISHLKRCVDKYDPEAMFILANIYKLTNKNVYIEYMLKYLSVIDAKCYEYYLLYKEFDDTDNMIKYLYKGVSNNEYNCFNKLLSDADSSISKLKVIFFNIIDIDNTLVKKNIFIITSKIEKIEPDFFQKYLNDKKLLNDTKRENTMYQFFGIILGIVVLKFIFH